MLLREHRRQLGSATSVEDAEAEETKIKALERSLKIFEDVLEENPPDEDFIDIFEELLRQLQTGVDDFEKKLAKLGEGEERKLPEPPSERYIQLLHSFEDVLHEYGRLLSSFEKLLNRFKAPPANAVSSFESLLKGFTNSLKSFEDLLGPVTGFVPPADDQKFLDSFWKLVRRLEKLLSSFEDLIKAQKPTSVTLTESFSELLGGISLGRPWDPTLGGLLESLASLIDSHVPNDPINLTPEDETLIRNYERALHRAEALLFSFAELVREHAAKRPRLLKEFEDQLHALEDRLGDFETIISDSAPRNTALIWSFEWLLHGLVKLLRMFHTILKENDPKNADRIESFESLIRGFEARLESFEDLLKALRTVDSDLVLSFETLFHDLADLLQKFETRRRRATFPDPDRVARSHKNLNDRFQKLQGSLEKLKERFPEIPEDLLKSDVRAGDETLARLEAFLRTLRRPSSAEATEFTRSVVDGAKTLIALCDVLLRQKPLSRPVVGGFQKVVARERRLVAAARSRFKRPARSSIILREALEDAGWLQTQLEERARQLR